MKVKELLNKIIESIDNGELKLDSEVSANICTQDIHENDLYYSSEVIAANICFRLDSATELSIVARTIHI